MKRLVLDSSYLVAHFNARDAHHPRALEIETQFTEGRWDGLLLLDGVFAETITVLQRRAGYTHAKRIGEVLLTAEEITWVALSDHRDEAWHQFLAQSSGHLSLIDCALVAVAKAYRATDIATFDERFDEVGDVKRVP